MLLNRQDFVNFVQSPSIGIFVAKESQGFCNFVYQVILGKELARRLQHFPDASTSGMTQPILATLIVADLWLRNVVVVVGDPGEDKDKEFEVVAQSELDKEEGKNIQEQKIVEGALDETGKDGVKKEEDKKEKSVPEDEAWNVEGKVLQIHCLVHEKQVDGLLRFAEIMYWPHMNETRDCAEDAYAIFRSGNQKDFNPHLWDWLHGMVGGRL